jgi:hypothetical protein
MKEGAASGGPFLALSTTFALEEKGLRGGAGGLASSSSLRND